jgi:bifunctional DNA-binding transcriptional regulator/antitoxin component of YhaV-PrlF toxin-antitoxin module
MLYGMELTIDKFGRVVLPKKIREHLGVGLTMKVEARETAAGVLLVPVRKESGLTMKKGLLIHGKQGEKDEAIDWNRLVQDEREERIRHIAGV